MSFDFFVHSEIVELIIFFKIKEIRHIIFHEKFPKNYGLELNFFMFIFTFYYDLKIFGKDFVY